jgi:hypothetical protein
MSVPVVLSSESVAGAGTLTDHDHDHDYRHVRGTGIIIMTMIMIQASPGTARGGPAVPELMSMIMPAGCIMIISASGRPTIRGFEGPGWGGRILLVNMGRTAGQYDPRLSTPSLSRSGGFVKLSRPAIMT